jgi:hypothetical protein
MELHSVPRVTFGSRDVEGMRMNDPNYRHDEWKWPRPEEWNQRCYLDDAGLYIEPQERVFVDVRSEADPWYGHWATVNIFIESEEPLATVTFDDGLTDLVPRRALRRATEL